MTEYITKEAAIQAFEWGDADVFEDYGDGYNSGFSRESIKSAIDAIPAADVAQVVHGRWEYIQQTLNTLSQLRCSFCGWWSLDPSIDGAYNYCPNCGAKMRQEDL